MSAKITYNDFVKEIQGGQTLTLKCKDEKMEHDIVIEAFGGSVCETNYKLWGTWLFKSDLPVPSEDIVQEVNFTSNDWVYNKMDIRTVVEGTVVTYYREDNGDFTEVYKPEASPKWINDKYREVNYGKTPQSVSKAYYDYVNAYAEIVILEEWDGSFAFLVSFAISGTTYYAEEGMTWGEWFNSKYNTDNLVYGSPDYSIVVTLLNEPIKETDLINPNYGYSKVGGVVE